MKYLIPVFIVVFILFPVVVRAQIWGPIVPDINFCAGLDPYATKLCNLLIKIQQILYAIALVLAIIMVIIGGITYMTAGADEAKIGKARKLLTSAVIGFAIVVAFGFIIGIVREIIVNSFSG